mmetsp:Transcript_12603/g.50636  ORF Transcript_12603/g.50636 Transcript_12603/m.50636 type:complete len:343 (-) Transcript_12603:1375-2403(-)
MASRSVAATASAESAPPAPVYAGDAAGTASTSAPPGGRHPPGSSSLNLASASRFAALARSSASCASSGASLMARVGLFVTGSRACACALRSSTSASAERTGAAKASASNARRRNRTPSLRLSSTTVSPAPERPSFATSSSASMNLRFSAGPCSRKSRNAAPDVINSTARSQRSLGSGALASAMASVAAAATLLAIFTASFTRPLLFSLSDNARCASKASQHAGSSADFILLEHGHGDQLHAHKSFNRPGNACCSACKPACARSLFCLWRFARSLATLAAVPHVMPSRPGARSSPLASSLNTLPQTAASLCAKSLPPASAYSRLVPRHACCLASNVCMSLFRS